MPQYNLIQRPDLNDRLVRSLGIRERAPAPSLSPEVQAVILLEDLTTSSPFERSLMRECGGFITAGPVAGQYSGIAINNPAGSGCVIRFDRAQVWAAAASRIDIGPWAQAVPAGTGSRYFMDPRFGGQPTGQLRNGTSIVTPVNPVTGWYEVAANTPVDLDRLGIIIPPGYMAGISLATVNVMLSACLRWVEFIA